MEMKGSVSPEPSNHLKVNLGLPLLEEASYLHSSMQESRALNIPQKQGGPAGVIALAGRKFFWHAINLGANLSILYIHISLEPSRSYFIPACRTKGNLCVQLVGTKTHTPTKNYMALAGQL